MALDIVKLNEIIAKADAAGENKDGKITKTDSKEVTVFEQEIEKLNLADAEKATAYSLVGLEIKTTAPVELTKKEKKAQEQLEEKAERDKAFTEITGAYEKLRAEGKTEKDALKAVRKEYKGKGGQYHELLRERGTFNQQNSTFEDTYIVPTENQRVRDEVKAAYLACLNNVDPALGRKMNEEEAYEHVKGIFKAKGGRYKELLRDRGFFNHKDSTFETDVVRPLAFEKTLAAIDATNADTRHDIREQGNEILEKSGNLNKYTEIKRRSAKAVLTGEDTTRNDIAVGNEKRNTIKEGAKKQSKADVMDALDNNAVLFQALNNANTQDGALKGQALITTKDGQCDLTVLSDYIDSHFGYDDYGNRREKYNMADEEIYVMQKNLKAELANRGYNLSDDEVIDLVKLCKLPYDKKVNILKVLGKTLGGAIGGALAAGLPEQTRSNKPHQYTKNDKIETFYHLDTSDIDNMSYKVFINGEEVPQENLGNVFDVKVPENVGDAAQVVVDVAVSCDNLKDIVFKGGRFVMSNAMKGAVIGAALGALDGITDDQNKETPVTSLKIDCTDLKTYLHQLEYSEDYEAQYKDIITTIATTFSDDKGNWDCVGYKEFLNNAAGNGVLNKEELVEALIIRQKELAAKKEVKQEVKPEEYSYSSTFKSAVDPKYEEVPTIDGTNTSWRKIASQYDCLIEKYGETSTIRMLKIAQAITDGDYSEERMVKLLKLSYPTFAGKLKNEKGFNYDTYYNVLTADLLAKKEEDKKDSGVKVPTNLAGCKRDASKSLNDNLYDKNDKTKKKASNGHAYDRIKIEDAQAEKIYGRFNENGTNREKEYNTFDELNKDVKEFKEKHSEAVEVPWS